MSIELAATSSRYLDILDVSNILYVETIKSAKQRDRKVTSCRGVNIAGITEILHHIAMNWKCNRRTVLCMDSFSDKKRVSDGYKANRVFHPEIAVQSQIIEHYFPQFGVEVLKRPGFEADDLIYSAVYGSIDEHVIINLHTGDSDIYGAVISPKVVIVGTSSITPSFNSTTYSKLCDSHMEIPYNTILANKVFYGKPSNNIGVLKLSKPKSYYYQGYVQWLQNSEYAMWQGSELGTFIDFLTECLDETNPYVSMTQEEIQKTLARTELIYPKIEPISIPCKAPPIDVEALLKFMQFYNQFTACKIMGLQNYYNTVPVDKEYDAFIRRMYATVQSGTFNADNHLGGDAIPLAKTTSEFMPLEEW